MGKFVFLSVIGIMLLFQSVALKAQPQIETYTVVEGKKFNYYHRKSKAALKKGGQRESTMQAIQALIVAEKKGHLKKAREVLSEALKTTIINSEREISEIADGNTVYENSKSIENQMRHLKILKELEIIQISYKNIPSHKLNSKGGLNCQLQPKDYSEEISLSTQLLSEFLLKGAEDYYTQALSYEGSQKWQVQFQRAKLLEKAVYYAPKYKDARKKYAEARKAGTCNLVIGAITNSSGKGLFPSDKMRDVVFRELKNDTKGVDKNKYFQLFANQVSAKGTANVELRLDIDNVYMETKESEPEKKAHRKEVDDVFVAALSTHYEKSAEVHVSGNYWVRDIETNEVLHSDRFSIEESWYHSWAVISGNIKAVDRSTKLQAKKKNVPFPSLQEMLGTSANGIRGLETKLKSVIAAFAASYN